jgi:hypothetical protein
LLADSALEGLRPAMDRAMAPAPTGADERSLEARLDALVLNMMKLAFENEALLRTMIQQTVLETPLTEIPRRGTRRVDWIEAALSPLRSQLSKANFRRMVSALAVCTGIEAILVLRDIRGLTAPQTTQMSRWMAQAMLREVLGANKRKGDRH